MRVKILLLICCIFPLMAFASEDGIHYVYGDLKYELTGLNASTALTQRGYDDNEFHSWGYHCIYNQREYYTIPDVITLGNTGKTARVIGIGMYSFLNAHALKGISLGSSIKSIGIYAFKGCTALEKIDIPYNANSIGDGAFSGCSSLKSVYFDSSDLTNLAPKLFENCTSLVNVYLPSSLQHIRNSFVGCSKLEDLLIPKNVTSVSDQAFDGCYSLKKIAYPSGLSITTPYPCHEIAYPRTATLLNGNVYNQEKDMIYYIRNDISGTYSLPKNIIKLGDYAGAYLEQLEELVIPESMTDMGNETFNGCRSLKIVRSNAKVPPTGKNIFDQATMNQGILYVPTGCKDAYIKSDAWNG